MPPAPATSADALSQLNTAQSQVQNPNDILGAQRQQLGVNAGQQTVTGLQGAIDNTTNLLNKVAPSVMGRTANSLVTNAQANRIIQNEQAPISSQLNTENTDLSKASADLANKESQAETAAGNIYKGQQDKVSYLQNLYNTLYGREQDQAKTAADAAATQEGIREFNVSQSNQNARSASSAASKAPSRSDVTSAIQSGLQSVVGKDGYVSPQDYAKGLADWLAAGLPRADYNKQYKNYRNPNNAYYDYAIKQAGL